MILLDTNLLGRITNSADPQCASARRAMHVLPPRGERLVIVPQNLYEFWAIATRMPAANGLGMAPARASPWLDFFQRRFTLLPDRDDLPARWHELVKTLGIKGFRAHDARLAAAMQSYGISRLLTFNGQDFKDLPVTIVDPTSV
jgi:predicted nucleic acid-binding protein